jgi:CheY-like chemotaxis protein
MNSRSKPVVILVADDDADDRLMIKEALEENRLANNLHFVEDGEELMAYLRRKNQYASAALSPRPGLILLDLNMPKMDGREALKEIKSDPELRGIPVIVLTTSKAEEDIYRTYNLGVNSFITKPVTFDSLVTITRDLGRYWFEIVELPPEMTSQERAKRG